MNTRIQLKQTKQTADYPIDAKLERRFFLLFTLFVFLCCAAIICFGAVAANGLGSWEFYKSAGVSMFFFILWVSMIFSFRIADATFDTPLFVGIGVQIVVLMIFGGLMFCSVVIPEKTYDQIHTTSFSSEVQNIFVGRDDYVYMSVVNNDGREAWLKITKDNADIKVGDTITGTYIQGKANNNSDEHYESDLVINSVEHAGGSQ